MADELQEALRRDGYVFVPGAAFRKLVEARRPLPPESLEAFARSWESMPPDPYLARAGMARRRRHAVFRAEAGLVRQLPHRPHYQALDYNVLQGGFPRHLAAIDDEIACSPALRRLVSFGSEFFARANGGPTPWEVEAHQFRIEATRLAEGRPTPEGHHRDGVDFVLVVLIRRVNLESGTTTTHDDDGQELGAFTLTDPYDAVVVDDRRVLHGVTPVSRSNARSPGFRDVLVLTYRMTGEAAEFSGES